MPRRIHWSIKKAFTPVHGRFAIFPRGDRHPFKRLGTELGARFNLTVLPCRIADHERFVPESQCQHSKSHGTWIRRDRTLAL